MPKPSLVTADYRSSRVLHSNFPADHCCPVDEFLGSSWFPQLHEINPPAMGQSMEKLWTSAKLHKVGAIVASCRIGFQTKTCLFTFTSHQDSLGLSWVNHRFVFGCNWKEHSQNLESIGKRCGLHPCFASLHWLMISHSLVPRSHLKCQSRLLQHEVTAPQSLLWLTYVFPTKATNNPSRMFSLEQS